MCTPNAMSTAAIPRNPPPITDFAQLVGKTIASARQQKLKGFDDEGFLRLDFTDGMHCTVIGTYGHDTPTCTGEYQTKVYLADAGYEAWLEDLAKNLNPSRKATPEYEHQVQTRR